MAASDLSVLLDMGFEEERAQLAVKQTGGCMFIYIGCYVAAISSHAYCYSVQGALQWLEDNQDKSLEDIKAPATKAKDGEDNPNELPPNLLEGEVAKSLVCNECGKKFRSVAQAQFHGDKTLDSPSISRFFVHYADMRII
jgi:UBX domain-containing protein 1/4